jgi:prepilin-type N-terminal cleavage/methylation domain-containing protein
MTRISGLIAALAAVAEDGDEGFRQQRLRGPTERCRGMTLIEVLVVVFLIGLLLIVALAAVDNSRRTAARVLCSSNLHQVGEALHQYANVFGQLPAGRLPRLDPNTPIAGRSVFVALLPFVGAEVIFNQYNFSVSPNSLANLTVDLARPGVFICPSDLGSGLIVAEGPHSRAPSPDPANGTWPKALTNFGFMYGTLRYPWELGGSPPYDPYHQINGCFNDIQKITLADITDGLSHTAFASELALEYINRDRINPFGHWVSSSTLLYASVPPNTLFKLPPRDYRIHTVVESVSSSHGDGANVLLRDSSVRFVRATVDSWPVDPELFMPSGMTQMPGGFLNAPSPGVWQALTTRSGGEIIGEF